MRALAEQSSVIVFRVGRFYCALPVTDIDSVVVPQPLTLLPQQPPWAKGIFQFRGHPIGVISLFYKFGLPEPSKLEDGRFLVVYGHKGSAAFWVDEIYDISTDYKSHTAVPPQGPNGAIFDKILEWDGHLVLLCDVNRLLALQVAVNCEQWLPNGDTAQTEKTSPEADVGHQSEETKLVSVVDNTVETPNSIDDVSEKIETTELAQTDTIETKAELPGMEQNIPEPAVDLGNNSTLELTAASELVGIQTGEIENRVESTTLVQSNVNSVTPLRLVAPSLNKDIILDAPQTIGLSELAEQHAQKQKSDSSDVNVDKSVFENTEPLARLEDNLANESEREFSNVVAEDHNVETVVATKKDSLIPDKETSEAPVWQESTPIDWKEEIGVVDHVVSETTQDTVDSTFDHKDVNQIGSARVTGNDTIEKIYSRRLDADATAPSFDQSTVKNDELSEIDSEPVIKKNIAAFDDAPAVKLGNKSFSSENRKLAYIGVVAAVIVLSIGYGFYKSTENETPAIVKAQSKIMPKQSAIGVAATPQSDVQSQVDVSASMPQEAQTPISAPVEKEPSIVDNVKVENSVSSPKEASKKIDVAVKTKEKNKQANVLVHSVKRGETLWQLTGQYMSSPFDFPDVAEKNKIENPDLIYPNDQIQFNVKKNKTTNR